MAANGTVHGRNRTKVKEWAHATVAYVTSSGLDGIVIDLESTHPEYASEVVDAVCMLKREGRAAQSDSWLHLEVCDVDGGGRRQCQI